VGQIPALPPAEVRYLANLLGFKAKAASDKLAQPASLANNAAWLHLLLQDNETIDAAHVLHEHVALLEVDNAAACEAMCNIARRVPWHADFSTPGGPPLFCLKCSYVLLLLIHHPATPPLQGEELKGLLAKLTSSLPENPNGTPPQVRSLRGPAPACLDAVVRSVPRR
jgi:hypothetical protein